MYIERWEDFYAAAEELYVADPLRTRYVAKYRHCDGKLVLKVTDDKTCLQYKTDQQTELKRVEKLNRLFLSLMATGQRPAEDVEMAPAPAAAAASGGSSQQQQQRGAKTRRKG